MTTNPLAAVKAAVYARLVALYPSAQVSYGTPGDPYSGDQVVVTDATVDVAYGPYSRQQHDVKLQVIFSCWRDGDATQQQVATEAALALLDSFDAFLRSAGTDPFALRPSLQQVQWAKLGSYTLEEEAVNDPESQAFGRLSNVITTLEISVRP